MMIDFSKQSLWIAAFSIMFNPLFWNIVARKEFRDQFMSKRLTSKVACYLLAFTIFVLGLLRDYLFKIAIEEQPFIETDSKFWLACSIACMATGYVFVISSMYVLGITGTYLGDYFGILMDEPVTSFPFNILDNPMYNGSTLIFLGSSLWYKSPAGLILTAFVFVVYEVALLFEGPFTANIYAQRAKTKDIKKK